jgi:hypothetical protein
VPGFFGTYTRLSSATQKEPESFSVIIKSSHEFAADMDVSGCGKIASDYIDVIQALLDEPSLRLQATCSIQDAQSKGKTQRYGPLSLPCVVSIIVYGPGSLIDNVGGFFQDVEMYLQDPKGCDTNLRYCNPHRLSSLYIDDCPMTFDLDRPGADIDQTLFQNVSGESDVLDILDAQEHLPESPQPELILPSLKK